VSDVSPSESQVDGTSSVRVRNSDLAEATLASPSQIQSESAGNASNRPQPSPDGFQLRPRQKPGSTRVRRAMQRLAREAALAAMLAPRNGLVGKNCTRCGEWNPVAGFTPHRAGLLGCTGICKRCRNAALRAKTAARPPKPPRPRIDPEILFWRHVSPEPNTGCWLWDGATNNHGYGHFRPHFGPVYAHRFSFALHHGRNERGVGVLDHRVCQQPNCCNPLHLEEVTTAENCRRGKRAKITKQDAVDIRRAFASGESHTALGAQYGLHPSYIYRIVNRQRWAVDMEDVEGAAAQVENADRADRSAARRRRLATTASASLAPTPRAAGGTR
jgi:hypothetical protein